MTAIPSTPPTASGSTATQLVLMMPDYRIDNPYQLLLAQALAQQGINVQFPNGYRRVFPLFRQLQSCTERVDILHIHWLSPFLKGESWIAKFIYCIKFILDILLTKWSGRKIIWTIHNSAAHETKFPKLERWTQQMLFHLVDHAIVHHRSTAAKIAQTYRVAPTKLSVIPHGHYRGVYGNAIDSKQARQQLGLPETGLIYLNLGMLRPYKGIEHLLEIWRQHQSVLAGSTLLIAGKPLDEAYGDHLIKQAAGLDNIIIHPEFIENDKIPLYFSAADITVFPFERISTSGSLILSMSYSKPSIAPNIASIAETLDEANHLLYQPGQLGGLFSVIQKSHQIDLDMIKDCVSRVCARLDWKDIAEKTNQVYEAASR